MNTFLSPSDLVECLLYEAGDGQIPWLKAEQDAVGQWVKTSGGEPVQWDWDGRNMILKVKERDGSTTTVKGADIAAANPEDWRFNRIRHAQRRAASAA